MKIVFFSPGKEARPWLQSLAGQMPEAEIWAWSPDTATRQADYAVVWAPPRELLAGQQRLRAIFNIGAGVDRVAGLQDVAALTRGVPVVRLNDAGMAVQMAEYVCHALIRHARNLDAYDAQQARGEWKVLPPIDRAAWPVGIMGLGDIGARVARSVAAFDYPTFGWSRGPKAVPGVTTFAGADGLDAFLRAVRVLVCVLPLTDETGGILNAGTLSRLRRPACLINVARGQHLVEADLLALLDAGHLAGATLDVFRDEPLPREHPFWTHPRITLTPHVSAITLRDDSAQQIARKIRAFERGEPVDGIVDFARGY